MKRILQTIFYFIPFFSSASDSLYTKPFVVKTDLLALVVPLTGNESYFSITPEKGIAKKQSLQLQFFHDYFEPGNSSSDLRIQLTLEYKYYLGKLYNSVFIGAYAKYEHFSHTAYTVFNLYGQPLPHREESSEYVSQSIGGGAFIGYEKRIAKHWLAEIIFGLGRKMIISKDTYDYYYEIGYIEDKYQADGVASLNVGYVF